jgi:hypothetical protein
VFYSSKRSNIQDRILGRVRGTSVRPSVTILIAALFVLSIGVRDAKAAAIATAEIIQLTLTFTLNNNQGFDPFEGAGGSSATMGLGALGGKSFQVLGDESSNCTIFVCRGPNADDPQGNYRAFLFVGPTSAIAIPPPEMSFYANVLVGLLMLFNFDTNAQAITFNYNFAYTLSAFGAVSSASVFFDQDLNPVYSDSVTNDNSKVFAANGSFQVLLPPGTIRIEDGTQVIVPSEHLLNLQAGTLTQAAVPEPSSLGLFGVGAVALLGYRGRSIWRPITRRRTATPPRS